MSSVEDQWRECRAGELRAMVLARRAERHRRQAARWVSVAAVAAVLIVGGLAVKRSRLSPPAGPLPCEQVLHLVSDYSDDALAPSTRTAVERHLEHCRSCRQYYQDHRLANQHAAVW